jgi:hypothetical protein
MFNGRGTLIFAMSVNKYVGMFKNDLFNGQRIYTYANAHFRMICSTDRGAIAMPMATAMSASSKMIYSMVR